MIQEALKQIDVLPRQVMIEAFLAEVTLNNNLRYGVQWFFDSSENTVTLSATDTGSVASQFPGFSYGRLEKPLHRPPLVKLHRPEPCSLYR